MAKRLPTRLLAAVGSYALGLWTYTLLFFLSIRSGSFFRKPTEKDTNDLAIARDQAWNLAKTPIPGFSHHFYRLRSGRQLHYVCSQELRQQEGNLVIFIHGFPDSYLMWAPLLQEPSIPSREATYVCVDLPGYGGSDSFEVHDTNVLEALAEFIIAMRDTFLKFNSNGEPSQSTYVVAHDWGAVLANRLASEAPTLADRFILANGPPVELMFLNQRRILESSKKIFKQFRQSPWTNFGCLSKSLKTISPLITQLLMSGYIFAFHLPEFMVNYLGSGGNLAFIRGVNSMQFGDKKPRMFIAEALATVLGPSVSECKPQVANGVNGTGSQGYGPTVLKRAKSPAAAFYDMTSYYRDGPAHKPWTKSLELIADLYAIDAQASESSSPSRRRSSSSASSALFTPQIKGMLHAPTTILWGEKDPALSRALCLDGLSDFLTRDSEVILLPRSGHWTPLEPDSKAAMARVVGLYASDRNNKLIGLPVAKYAAEVYEGATQVVKK